MGTWLKPSQDRLACFCLDTWLRDFRLFEFSFWDANLGSILMVLKGKGAEKTDTELSVNSEEIDSKN